MQSLANRNCEICGAARYGNSEDFDEWIIAHKLAEHTSHASMLQTFVSDEITLIQNEIDFLSSNPSEKEIKGWLPGLRETLSMLKKIKDEMETQTPGGPPSPSGGGSSSGFALT
jgi:hypothetical protein